MSAPSPTPNLGLLGHDDASFADGRGLGILTDQINTNMATIDAAVGALDTELAAIGTTIGLTSTVTSNLILHTASKKIFTAAGKVRVESILLNTDATGLAAGTNFEVLHNSTVVAAETVANLGASAEVDAGKASVTALAGFVMDSTDTLNVESTVANCTGSGKITLTILARRLTAGASLS